MSENPPDPKVSEFIDMSLLRAPRSYQCRVYVVKGMHLQPKDVNGLADPYLHFKVDNVLDYSTSTYVYPLCLLKIQPIVITSSVCPKAVEA